MVSLNFIKPQIGERGNKEEMLIKIAKLIASRNRWYSNVLEGLQ